MGIVYVADSLRGTYRADHWLIKVSGGGVCYFRHLELCFTNEHEVYGSINNE